jgi:LmbE family N-acetylglucosaminyl deacetylase
MRYTHPDHSRQPNLTTAAASRKEVPGRRALVSNAKLEGEESERRLYAAKMMMDDAR